MTQRYINMSAKRIMSMRRIMYCMYIFKFVSVRQNSSHYIVEWHIKCSVCVINLFELKSTLQTYIYIYIYIYIAACFLTSGVDA